MTTRDRFRPSRLVFALAAAVLICGALIYLGEYVEVHWVREAGGMFVPRSSLPKGHLAAAVIPLIWVTSASSSGGRAVSGNGARAVQC